MVGDANVDDEDGWLFGGGLGYLLCPTTGRPLATSAYVAGDPLPREFGVGYARNMGKSIDGLLLEHTVAVMPGQEPVVHIEAVIHNKGGAARNITYAEVWGSAMVHQLTGVGWGGWSRALLNSSTASLLDRRAFVQQHYRSTFQRLNTSIAVGMLQVMAWTLPVRAHVPDGLSPHHCLICLSEPAVHGPHSCRTASL